MPGVKFTKENLLERNRLEPGWYELDIKNFVEAESKDKQSINFVGDFVVACGPQAGTPIRNYMNEQVMGRITDYMMCFVKDDKELLGKDVIDLLKQTVGRKVMGYCRFDSERKWNTIEDFRPSQKATA